MPSCQLQLKLANTKSPVNVHIDAPDGHAATLGVVLMHGAGGDLSSGILPQLAARLQEAGLVCVRFTYRAPNLKARTKACQEVMAQSSSWPETRAVTSWVCAGHSMGARVACEIAYSSAIRELDFRVLGAVLLSYPLHPPGEPGELRDEPLCSLSLPLLFVRGTRDEFCSQEQWDQVLPRMASKAVKVHEVDGAGHGLMLPGKRSGTQEQSDALSEAIRAAVEFVAALAAGQSSKKNG